MVEGVPTSEVPVIVLPVECGMPHSASCARSSSAKGYNLLLQLVSASAENGCIPGFRSKLLSETEFRFASDPTCSCVA